jgi:hypothetical protein
MQKFECVLVMTSLTSSNLLKQLALFYDKIHIASPAVSGILPEVWSELHGGDPEGKLTRPINYFRDTERLMRLPLESYFWRDPHVAEVISYLKEKEIVETRDFQDYTIPKATQRLIRNWTKMAADLDIKDPHFNSLCNTSPDDFKRWSIRHLST